jgi:hypothetical protein
MALNQSTDLVERLYNLADAMLKAYETAKVAGAHYLALGGATALDPYFSTSADPNGPSKAELVSAVTSLSAIVQFIDSNNHDDVIYKVKTLGSSIKLN